MIDWFSRYVISWEVSTRLETSFCLRALDQALEQGRPEIFNTDQGSQFTSLDFTPRLLAAQVRISMDGRGRALDNILVERLWRSVKQEEIYIKDYRTVLEAVNSLRNYFEFITRPGCINRWIIRPQPGSISEKKIGSPSFHLKFVQFLS